MELTGALITDASVNRQDVSVQLSVRGHRLKISGTLSWKGSRRGRTVQVLVPGYTYGRHYWDFPHRLGKYSYVRAAVGAGYATLAAVVTALREGHIADTVSNRIVTVGHSLRSAIVAAHAVSATLDTDVGEVDGSILTGPGVHERGRRRVPVV
jgi:hypothetical protein